MRTVRDADGDRYLLLKESDESSLVRDPESGAERYVANSDLDFVDESPLATAAAGIDSAVRRLVTATYDDQSLGLLVELVDGGPLATVELLDSYDLCESDLHGLLAEFRAAGLVAEAESAGQRGYDATDLTREAVAELRNGGAGETDETGETGETGETDATAE